jgi:hypothetical protein
MQTLIGQCWTRDPAGRPSFGEIFDMFKSRNFELVPDTDRVKIRDFADGIVEWESRSPARSSHLCQAV